MNAREFSVRLSDLLSRERGAMAEFLVQLAEFDRRKLWLDLGHCSLFAFLRQLGLVKSSASYRTKAVELIHRFPAIIEPLRDGRLCLSTVHELSNVLTPENQGEVLPRFFGLSKQEAKELVADLKPAEDAPRRDVVTAVRLPAARPVAATLELRAPPANVAPASSAGGSPDEPVDANSPARIVNAPTSHRERDHVDPLTAELSRLHATVSRQFLAKLAAARDALSHSHPGATMEEILGAGLDLLLAESARRKGLVAKPQRKLRPSKPGHIPAAVKRAVWERDRGCCQWPVDGGGICGSTYQLELDHRTPKALGGSSTVDDVRILCRRHNLLAARQAFGDEWMSRFIRIPATDEPAPMLADASPP
jgi:hypothetical protein